VTASTGHRDPAHDHLGADEQTVLLEKRILAKNNHLADHNRDWLTGRGVTAINLMSSPGSGKTTLLERSLRDLADRYSVAVLEGDQETLIDAERIRATGAPVLQVNTGSGCHLDAAMVSGALPHLDPRPGAVLFIENVGNLICPVLFDLGEHHKVVLAAVTEGTDKPLKYPHMFGAATLVLLNKIDLLPHVSFELAEFTDHVRRVNPTAPILHISATRGDGLDDWYRWLHEHRAPTQPG
jgi:hydrogenase nickel incorporation protein HypB